MKYYALNSTTTQMRQINKYFKFIDDFSGYYAPFPCDPMQVTLYATWLARSLNSSILNYLSVLNYFLTNNGSEQIDYCNFVFKSMIKGIRRELGDMTKCAMPILPHMLLEMF